jgi:hypothetical protein
MGLSVLVGRSFAVHFDRSESPRPLTPGALTRGRLSQDRVDSEGHQRYAQCEHRPSGPKRDGSSCNRKEGTHSANAEQCQSIYSADLYSHHLTTSCRCIDVALPQL